MDEKQKAGAFGLVISLIIIGMFVVFFWALFVWGMSLVPWGRIDTWLASPPGRIELIAMCLSTIIISWRIHKK